MKLKLIRMARLLNRSGSFACALGAERLMLAWLLRQPISTERDELINALL